MNGKNHHTMSGGKKTYTETFMFEERDPLTAPGTGELLPHTCVKAASFHLVPSPGKQKQSQSPVSDEP